MTPEAVILCVKGAGEKIVAEMNHGSGLLVRDRLNELVIDVEKYLRDHKPEELYVTMGSLMEGELQNNDRILLAIANGFKKDTELFLVEAYKDNPDYKGIYFETGIDGVYLFELRETTQPSDGELTDGTKKNTRVSFYLVGENYLPENAA